MPLNNKIPPAAAGYPSIDWINAAPPPPPNALRESENVLSLTGSRIILPRSSLSLSLIRLCCVYAECVSAESTLHPNTLIGMSSGPRRARSQTVRQVGGGLSVTVRKGGSSIQDDDATHSPKVYCVCDEG